MLPRVGVDLATTSSRVAFLTQGVAVRISHLWGTALHAAGLSASVVLYATSQPPYAFPWLAPLALVPWLLVVSRRKTVIGALSGYAFVTIWGTLSNGWIVGALEELGGSPPATVLSAFPVVIMGGGLSWTVIGAVAAATGSASPGRRVAALAATFFTTGWATHWLPSGLPWETLGHSQAWDSGVAQLAAIGGVPLVSGLVAAANAAIAALLVAPAGKPRERAWHCTAATAGVYGAAAFFGVPAAQWARAPETPRDAFELLVVQPDLPRGERWVSSVQRTNLAIVGQQTAAALAYSSRPPDLIVWPEMVLTNPLDADEALRKDLMAWVRRLGVPVILGAARGPAHSDDPSHYRNSVVRVDPEGGIVAGFDKTWTIPGIESATLPWETTLRAALGLPPAQRSVEKGQRDQPLGGSPSFAVAVCFEALFPGLVAARRDADTAAILVLANDSWFASNTPSRQHLAFASFRAIEQRLWLVRASLNGISAIVDPYGRRVSELPFGVKGTLRARVFATPPPGTTEKLVLLLVLLVGGTLGWIAATAVTRRVA